MRGTKERAEEIFNKYFSEIRMPYDCEGCMQCVVRCETMVAVAKKYSLIAVNEMLDFRNALYVNDNSLAHQYLLEIKEHLEKL